MYIIIIDMEFVFTKLTKINKLIRLECRNAVNEEVSSMTVISDSKAVDCFICLELVS